MQKLSKRRMDNRGVSFNQIPGIVISLIIIVITLVIGAIVVSNLGDTTTNANATKIVGYGQAAFVTFGSWLGIMVVIILAAVIFGLFRYFGGAGGNMAY